MNEDLSLLDRFEAERPRLRAVAYRMLGSADEADGAVQEAWLRLNRTDRIPEADRRRRQRDRHHRRAGPAGPADDHAGHRSGRHLIGERPADTVITLSQLLGARRRD